MTSALEGGVRNYQTNLDRRLRLQREGWLSKRREMRTRGEGIKISEIFVDVMYGSPSVDVASIYPQSSAPLATSGTDLPP